ncbi:transcriptional regulatory protein [Zafaria cholistanensis]|uniref:Transcriptional regulatory protein n=1 Tax=Zafaria cholistanensis TaxID=1682741 RepID=A0A5A7NRY5_9MICC|nr:response regulator [Zafaria cholistanensis]GER23356.1 transcriptional regulatory protein [Zafaria cholistanensis]
MSEGNDLKVLVVDDDFRVAGLHAAYVDAVPGFVALPPVHDVRTVPRVVAETRPDLLLLDVYLPHGSGLDLMRELDVDAFVLSAAVEGPAVRTALRRGALAYLVKPFEERMLADRLRAYARYRRLLAADVLDQTAIDRARRVLLAGEEAAPSSGAATEQAVLAAVSAAGDELSVVEVAEAVGISRATAQRYLSQLAQAGQIRLGLRYGLRGRPEHRYGAVR